METKDIILDLRTKKGLSQEELGFKLNVTRQTVSKWELGQTTPEMDKLVEISKIFGVTIDELTSERETINNEDSKIAFQRMCGQGKYIDNLRNLRPLKFQRQGAERISLCRKFAYFCRRSGL